MCQKKNRSTKKRVEKIERNLLWCLLRRVIQSKRMSRWPNRAHSLAQMPSRSRCIDWPLPTLALLQWHPPVGSFMFQNQHFKLSRGGFIIRYQHVLYIKYDPPLLDLEVQWLRTIACRLELLVYDAYSYQGQPKRNAACNSLAFPSRPSVCGLELRTSVCGLKLVGEVGRCFLGRLHPVTR